MSILAKGSMYCVSPQSSSSPSNSNVSDAEDSIQKMLDQGEYMKICSKYKKHWGYIFSVFCQAKVIDVENGHYVSWMEFSLSTEIGKRLLAEFPHHYHPLLRNVEPKSPSYGLKDFALDPTLENFSENISVSPELEVNQDFIRVTFQKGWTKYLSYTDSCIHTLLSVLAEPDRDSGPFLEFLSKVKRECVYLNLSLLEYTLLCRLVPEVTFHPKFSSADYAYLLGIYDMHIRLDGSDEHKLSTLIARSLFQARENPEAWRKKILRKNKAQLDALIEDMTMIYGLEKEEIVRNKEDVLMEKVSKYQPFDVYYYPTVNGHIYQFSRPEFETLISELINMYTREPLTGNIINAINFRSINARNMLLPASQTLEELMKMIPEPQSAEEVFKDEVLIHRESSASNEDILLFMYSNYSFWVHKYLHMSSTIYSYLFRCFRYWYLLHEIEGNYTATICLNIIGNVQMKFPHMTDKDCIKFIISNQDLVKSNDKYKLSFINFCSTWFRLYNPKNIYIEHSFVQNCNSMLRKYLNHK